MGVCGGRAPGPIFFALQPIPHRISLGVVCKTIGGERDVKHSIHATRDEF
jgi:hypothetical protein